jgi:hypothetical protein
MLDIQSHARHPRAPLPALQVMLQDVAILPDTAHVRECRQTHLHQVIHLMRGDPACVMLSMEEVNEERSWR